MLSSWALHGAAPPSSRPRIARPGLSPQASTLVEVVLTLAASRWPPSCFLSLFLQTLPMHGAAPLALHGAAPSSRRRVGGVLKLVSLAFSVWPREAPKGTLSSSGSGQRVGQAWTSDALVLHGIRVSYVRRNRESGWRCVISGFWEGCSCAKCPFPMGHADTVFFLGVSGRRLARPFAA